MTDARNRQPAGVPIGGEFAANAHDGAPSGLPAEPEYTSPAISATIVQERWDDRDNAQEIGRETIDLTKVLDGYALDDLPESTDHLGETDQFYDDAQKLGLIDGHGGPFTVWIDEDEYQAYVESRRAAGKDDAISRIPRHTPAEHNRIVNEAFDRAFPPSGFISVANWKDGTEARAWARGAIAQINERFEANRIEDIAIDPSDDEIVRNISAVAQGTDDAVKSPQYLNGAQRVAFLLGDRMIERARAERAPF